MLLLINFNIFMHLVKLLKIQCNCFYYFVSDVCYAYVIIAEKWYEQMPGFSLPFRLPLNRCNFNFNDFFLSVLQTKVFSFLDLISIIAELIALGSPILEYKANIEQCQALDKHFLLSKLNETWKKCWRWFFCVCLQHEFLIYIFIPHVHFAVYHSGIYWNCVDDQANDWWSEI